MRISQIISWISGFSAGILLFTVGLVSLGTFSRSFLQGGLWSTSEEFWFVPQVSNKRPDYPPVFAYWISGTGGDDVRIQRLLKAVYHPRNQYLLQLDAGSSDHEREKLTLSVQSERIFRDFGNVNVLGRSYAVDQTGSSALAATLHAAAMLLKISKYWDWFITLSASDYPLVTQDDLLHAFTLLPRDLNFISFNDNNKRKGQQRINQIVVDTNLYSQRKNPIFYAVEERATPDAFKIFGGSPWVILSKDFMEYCVQGWDNLPRKLLMYFTNVAFPLELYFHTVLCNSPDFRNTTVDNDLSYTVSNTLTDVKQDLFNLSQYAKMIGNGAAFGRKFKEDDLVLQKIDENVLRRPLDGVAPGRWCLGTGINQSTENSNIKKNSCSSWSDINTIAPGPFGLKLGGSLSKLVSEGRLKIDQCNQQ